LLFTHIIPPLPFAALEGAWLDRAGAIFHGRIRLGHDGDFVTLPAGGGQPRLTNRLTNLLRG
jgi:ribonuclease Z